MSGKPKKKGGEVVQKPVYLSGEDHKALRIAAIEEGRPATDIMRELVKEWLAKRKKRKGVK